MVKKLFAVLLILAISISAAACGKKKGGDAESAATGKNKPTVSQQYDAKDEDDQVQADDNNVKTVENEVQNGNDSPGGIYKEPGNELSDFYAAFDDAMGVFERAINHMPESDDFELFDISFDYLAPCNAILSVGGYDLIHILGSKEGEYREDSGGIITFGKEFTREEDGFGPSAKKGDVVREEGNLDTSSNALVFETSIERSGELIKREVAEVVMHTDGTFIAQILSKPVPQDNVEDKGNAYFVRCGKDDLEIIKARFEPDVNFTYDSILGKGDSTPEDMSQGYEKIRKLTVKNGEAATEKY
jgi:hypothetical protein